MSVRDLVKNFSVRGGVLSREIAKVQAVSKVSFDVFPGETLGLVGESGCGKSTTGRVLLRLIQPDIGRGDLRGHRRQLDAARALIQFRRNAPDRLPGPVRLAQPAQDHRAGDRRGPAGPPAWTGAGAGARQELLQLVGLSPEHATATRTSSPADSASASASPGRWRSSPKFIVLDEPVSALDVSIQAGVVNLLERAAGRARAHLPVHRPRPVGGAPHLRPRRRDVPRQDRRDRHPRPDLRVAGAPVHTGAAVGDPDPRPRPRASAPPRIKLFGDVPSPIDPPSGCRFRARCWLAQDICAVEEPELVDRDTDHPVACHFAKPIEVV